MLPIWMCPSTIRPFQRDFRMTTDHLPAIWNAQFNIQPSGMSSNGHNWAMSDFKANWKPGLCSPRRLYSMSNASMGCNVAFRSRWCFSMLSWLCSDFQLFLWRREKKLGPARLPHLMFVMNGTESCKINIARCWRVGLPWCTSTKLQASVASTNLQCPFQYCGFKEQNMV